MVFRDRVKGLVTRYLQASGLTSDAFFRYRLATCKESILSNVRDLAFWGGKEADNYPGVRLSDSYRAAA